MTLSAYFIFGFGFYLGLILSSDDRTLKQAIGGLMPGFILWPIGLLYSLCEIYQYRKRK